MKIRPATGLRAPRQALYGIGLVNSGSDYTAYSGDGDLDVRKASFSGIGTVKYAGTSSDRVDFGEIPEIVFVEGFQNQTEELALWICDPNRRVKPGDMWWWSNWDSPGVSPTRRRILLHDDHGGTFYTTGVPVSYEGALPPGVSFSSATGVISYSGTGRGDGTVRLYANGKYSNWFRVRVLRPTFIWGTNASTRSLPSALSTVPRHDAYVAGATISSVCSIYEDQEPLCALILEGQYSNTEEGGNWVIGSNTSLKNQSKYVIGEPGKFPRFYRPESTSSGSVTAMQFRWPDEYGDGAVREHVQYLKGLDFKGMTNVNAPTTALTARLYYCTQCYFHRDVAAEATSQDGFDSVGGDGFTATIPPTDTVNVGWFESSGFADLVGYRIYGSKDGGAYSLLRTVLVGDVQRAQNNRYPYTTFTDVPYGTWNYYVVGYNSTGGLSRRYANRVIKTVTGITNTDPAVVTIPAHGFANGSLVRLMNVEGMRSANGTPMNGDVYTVANATSNTFELQIYGKTKLYDSSALTGFVSADAENFDVSTVDDAASMSLAEPITRPVLRLTNDSVFAQHRVNKFETPSEDSPISDENNVRGGYLAPFTWETRYADHFWNVQMSRWIGSGGTKHPIYLHGYPYSFVFTNNVWWRGGYQASAVKTTRSYGQYHNCLFWEYEVEDITQAVGESLQRFTDIPSANNSVHYNCDFKSMSRMAEWCWQNNRATIWGGNLWPPYPDICTQAAPFKTFTVRLRQAGGGNGSVANGRIKGEHETAWRNTTGGAPFYFLSSGASSWDIPISPSDVPVSGTYTLRVNVDGTESTDPRSQATLLIHRDDQHLYVSSAYPQAGQIPLFPAVGAYPMEKFDQKGTYFSKARGAADALLDTHDNPYTSKHFFSYNRFYAGYTGTIKGEAVKDQTTYPLASCGTLGAYYKGDVPNNYHPLTQTFFANNSFYGWTIADEIWDAGASRWMGTEPLQDRGEYYHGLYPWAAETSNNARFYGVDSDGAIQFEDLGVSNIIPSATDAPRVTLPSWFQISTQHFRDEFDAPLRKAARELNPKQFVNLNCPDITTARDDRGRYLFDVSDTQDTGEIYLCGMNWGDNVAWDSVKRKITWVGSNHYSQGYNTDSKWYSYSTDTNTWAAVSSPHQSAPTSGNGPTPPIDPRTGVPGWKTGHTYEDNAFDARRRILWKHDSDVGVIRGLNVDDGTYWGRIYVPTSFYGFGRVLIYNPDIDALFYAVPNNKDGSLGQIWVRRSLGGTAYYDRSWELLADDCPFLTWHMVGHYHPRAKKTIIGGGYGGGIDSRAFYEVDNLLNVTRLPDSPYSISVSEPGAVLPEPPPTNDPKRAQFCHDPASNKSVIFSGNDGGKVYEYDHDTRSWSQNAVATLPFTNKNCVVCPIPDYNVIAVVQWGYGGNGTLNRMYLYRNT